MYKFAVLSFPGTNCEAESARAFIRAGMCAEIVRWNDEGILNGSRLSEFDGYCIAGGFSFEDRGRSGVIAAQEPIMEVIKKEAEAGKLILGICNGAQVLVETGLIPGYENGVLGMGLGWNEMRQGEEIVDTGFRNQWAYLKNVAPKGRSAFNDFDELIQIPLANGEGRYVIPDDLLQKLEANNQILFKFCDADGNINENYPITPNGAMKAIAAICNPAGNVMAIMPHPERDPLGNGQLIFQSIKHYLDQKPKTEYQSLGKGEVKSEVQSKEEFDVEVYVRLIITDNAERTIEEALMRKGFQLHLNRYEFFGLKFQPDIDQKDALQTVLKSGELANFNKHLVYLKTAEGVFQYDPATGLTPKTLDLNNAVLVCDEKDFMGEAKKASLNGHAGSILKTVKYGVLWHFSEAEEEMVKKVIASHVLHNPFSMKIYQ